VTAVAEPPAASPAPEPQPQPPASPQRSYVVQIVTKAVKRLGHDRTATTLTLFALLITKVLLVTHGDLLTSLALINDAGLVQVTIGVIMSLLPIAAALVMAAALYGWWCCRWRWDQRPRQLAVIAGVVFVSAWFSPWYLFFPAIAVSLALGVFDREQDELHPATMHGKAGQGFLILATAGIVYALGATLFTMWLPHEQLKIRDQSEQRIGYVVGDKGGYINMLTSGNRRIVRIPSSTVESRTLCRGSDFHESPIQWTARAVGRPLEYLPRCGELSESKSAPVTAAPPS